jgi:hypothetical protein
MYIVIAKIKFEFEKFILKEEKYSTMKKSQEKLVYYITEVEQARPEAFKQTTDDVTPRQSLQSKLGVKPATQEIQ